MRWDSLDFKAWLIQHRYDSVGRPCSIFSCPIATYLNEKLDDNLIMVSKEEYETSKHGQGNLPRWASQFVGAVDATKFEDITGEQALSIMKGIA